MKKLFVLALVSCLLGTPIGVRADQQGQNDDGQQGQNDDGDQGQHDDGDQGQNDDGQQNDDR